MYPRNAASPERIAIGQVVLIADGTVQSASVTITVRGQGGAEASGGGTTALGADNTVYYTPTQAETNFTSFVVIASKASCFSASQTIITSASSTAGNVILAGVTHTSAVIPTVTTLTGHTAQTGDSFARIGVDGQGLTDLGGSGNNWNVGKTGYSVLSTGLDAVLEDSTFLLALENQVWDAVLTGGSHNISTSAGRRLRTLQTGGAYEGGAIWVDTVNGTAGTVDDENGVVGLPVDTWADALTLSASLGLKNFHIANGSTVTLSAASANYFIYGHEWTLALGGQSVASTMVIDAAVSGTGTGVESEYEDCIFAITSLPAMQAYRCSFTATTSGGFTMSAAGDYRFVNCQSGVAGAGAPLFTLGTGAITAEFRRWSGGITFAGITADDVITVGGEMGTIDLGSPSGAADIQIRGTYKAVTNVGSATVNYDGAIKAADVATILADTDEIQGLAAGATGFAAIDTVVDAVKVQTDKMVFTKTNELDVNTKSINDAEVIGDGNATPWDGV